MRALLTCPIHGTFSEGDCAACGKMTPHPKREFARIKESTVGLVREISGVTIRGVFPEDERCAIQLDIDKINTAFAKECAERERLAYERAIKLMINMTWKLSITSTDKSTQAIINDVLRNVRQNIDFTTVEIRKLSEEAGR